MYISLTNVTYSNIKSKYYSDRIRSTSHYGEDSCRNQNYVCTCVQTKISKIRETSYCVIIPIHGQTHT